MHKSIAAILILISSATASTACTGFTTVEPAGATGSGGSPSTASTATSTGSATSSAGGNGGGPGYWDCASGTCKPAGVGYFAPGDDTRTACGTGTYSDSTTAAACTPCTNAPANSTAVTYAASSALSSNTCPLATVICSLPRIWNGMVCQDTTPIAFSFTDLTELAPVGVVTSDTVTPLGFEGPLTLTCTNCSALAKNGSFGGTSLTGVNPGDTITVREKSKKIVRLGDSLAAVDRRGVPQWLELDKDNFRGQIKSFPAREDFTMPIREQLIVELYSK